ncbi:unnamed protein product [Brugia timori]|uniref:Calpain catalytic domain-containing protein n=1 Tax=Brugia timori TaxID=42155 RepID=A0A0R3Q9S4_9BILA|nr:unnamed protein product [Brugia timori]
MCDNNFQMRCIRILNPSSAGSIYNTRHGYRIRFLRDFNKQEEPKLRTIPTKWKGRVQWWKEPIYIAPHVNVLQKGVDFTFQGYWLFVKDSFISDASRCISMKLVRTCANGCFVFFLFRNWKFWSFKSEFRKE